MGLRPKIKISTVARTKLGVYITYKVISKVIANRLKGVLDEIISQYQSVFVPSRMIFDNAMIVFETLHTMNEKHSGKHGNMALKLDMSRAYDRVEWLLLERVMRSIGLSEKWISLIMKCVFCQLISGY